MQLCNLSITLSAFPDKCKLAKLKPLFKKGSKTEPKNDRPISLLPLVSKIIDKVIHVRTQAFLTEHKFVENDISDLGNIICGVPQGSILGPLLFLLYVNDTCLIFSAKDLDVIQEQLDRDFNELCDWFVDNKLSIHFGEDKTKSILFTKRKKTEGLAMRI